MAALDKIASRSGARSVSVCSCAGASILSASERDDELTAGEKRRRAAI